MINMTDCWRYLSYFLRLWQRYPLTAPSLGFKVILKNQCLITSDYPTKQVWFSMKTLDDILTHQHAGLPLIIILQFWHHFYTDFPLAQIFHDYLPNIFPFYLKLACDQWNCQPTYCTNSVDFDFSPACWRPLAPTVIFYFFAASLNLLCHWKTSEQDMFLSPYICWNILSACNRAFLNEAKYFQFYLFHYILITEQPEKEV